MLMAIPVYSQAQVGLYAGAGYNFSLVNYGKVNFVIDRYNEARPYLTAKLPHFKTLHGPAILFGSKLGKNSKYSVNLDYGNYGNTVSANWSDPNGSFQSTYLKINHQIYSLTFGIFPEINEILKFGFGFSVFYGKYKFSVKSPEYAYSNTSSFTDIAEYDAVGLAPLVQLFIGLAPNLFLHLKPYYNFDVTLSDIYSLNKSLNPDTYIQDQDLDHGEKFNHFGMYSGLIFSF